MQDFRKLMVWQKARDLIAQVYRLSSVFPKDEIYGLTSQARRAAVSIAANIAEGRGCGTDKAFGRYLQMAVGSACELESHMIVASDLGYVPEQSVNQVVERITEVRRMIIALLQSLRDSEAFENSGHKLVPIEPWGVAYREPSRIGSRLTA